MLSILCTEICELCCVSKNKEVAKCTDCREQSYYKIRMLIGKLLNYETFEDVHYEIYMTQRKKLNRC